MSILSFWALALALLLCTALSCDLSASEERAVGKPYIYYTGLASPPINDIIDARLQEAFRRLDLKVKLHVTSSSQRALILANEEGDGDAHRISSIKEMAPNSTGNLIKIPESINSIKFYVYTKGNVFSVAGYQSLADYHNGFRSGAKILEKNIPGKRTALPQAKRLFQMLNEGRIDTVVELPFIADKIIRDNSYSEIRKSSLPLEDLPAFSFIHKKHQALIPKIVEALKEIKGDGTFLQIEKDVLEKFNLK